MDLETVAYGAKVILALGTIIGALNYVPKGYKWLRSWKLIKMSEFEQLKKIEAENQKRGTAQADPPTSSAAPPVKPKEYEWRGFLWLLRQPFWDNYNDLAVDQVDDVLLATAIHGPLCPKCKRDLSRVINAQKVACACSKQFNLKEIGTLRYPAEALRRGVYTDAQAAVRRGELHP